jgi:hypothetical protein
MPILVTVSVNLAESVTLRDLRLFVQAAERNSADLDVDLREYDENNDLVGLAAVGAMAEDDDEDDAKDDEDDEDDEDDTEDDEDDTEDDDEDVADDRGDADGGRS